ncbi:MAG TPA: hypothetical protein PLR07_08440 [Promineifilum sp.]|nr:hypothetical protein [Promineifilum sp.]
MGFDGHGGSFQPVAQEPVADEADDEHGQKFAQAGHEPVENEFALGRRFRWDGRLGRIDGLAKDVDDDLAGQDDLAQAGGAPGDCRDQGGGRGAEGKVEEQVDELQKTGDQAGLAAD